MVVDWTILSQSCGSSKAFLCLRNDFLKHGEAWLILYLRPPTNLKLPNFENRCFFNPQSGHKFVMDVLQRP